ncbi:hypothetical protein [Paenibacillus mucilaginosus]|uniref:FAD dependent oxidoreductase n=2 Tax=Paenibacillus mucilaginosus TaxID=61624 RepID=H6NCS1_9BACL|nr:hypothetical protein [Paenibacillus mucilaginosus]AEI40376.1 hypothetical protein KNP414_01814 [Paenibacillus mucilaginosus KNP414]AFC29000.1 hypothetical protein PM3016_2104 [Paenibacillus mucilaginosus 3016]MCG7213272.1 hypothetical protein [Paenibacillus mucilaginosus]WDM29569.1 hypothetical protein KCX80_10620 [Paenibacillus mucilaginosus]WFA17746.1 hypothetical protein ERY13_10880 [Paenibacillus mucilaginosus]
MKQDEHVPTLIIGASMLGLGLASSKGGDAVVLESGNSVGSEFIRSFKLSRPWIPAEEASPSREIREELTKRNIMSGEGSIHLPGLMPVMIKHIKEHDLQVRMQSSVVNVSMREGKFVVLYYDASGLRTITADKLVDTSIPCSTKPECLRVKAKSLNVMIMGLPEGSDFVAAEGYEIRRGRFDSETILRFPLDPNEDWISARSRLFQFWLNRPLSLKPYAFVTHAEEFDMEYEEARQQIAPGWEWLPSAFYANPLEAFDQGFHYGKGDF